MSNPIVSVIIPIYNVSEYVDACVESACRQSYTNLEIILVDDGSPDDCPQKCDDWAKKDSRIKVVHKPNGGLSDARNAGLDVATGKYIYFLDGDDTIEPNLIETVVPYMEDGADMVVFNWNKVTNNKTPLPMAYHELGLWEFDNSTQRNEFIFKYVLSGKIGWDAWSRIYSRKKIEQHHLRFADNRKIFAEDLYFCLCYCAHTKKIISIDSFLYNYLVRENSIMGEQNKKINVGRLNELSKAVLNYWSKFADCNELVKRFPVAHFMIVSHVMKNTREPLKTYRKKVLADIQDKNFFKKNIKQLFRHNKFLCDIYGKVFAYESLSFAQFLLHGSYSQMALTNRLIYKIQDILISSDKSKKEVYSSKKDSRIFLIATEDFGNIGDHQIAESIHYFVQTFGTNKIFKEITCREYKNEKPYLKKYIRPSDIILLTGGGNFGNEYAIQEIRDEIIKTWPQNFKIIFPQTIYFTNDSDGEKALEKTKQLYTKQNNVVLFLREKPSFEFAQKHYLCESYLVPDIVLSQNMCDSTKRNEQVLLCFRSDKERTTSDQKVDFVKDIISQKSLSAVKTDLQLNYHLNKKQRVAAINTALNQWKTSKLVITDRLHGMIFAAITGTPCIALSNYNHKVRGTYEFIKYLPYIRFAETEEEIKAAFDELILMDNCQYDNTPLIAYYEKLADVLKHD